MQRNGVDITDFFEFTWACHDMLVLFVMFLNECLVFIPVLSTGQPSELESAVMSNVMIAFS